MKIISQPDLSNWIYECDCYACKSKLGAEREDIRAKKISQSNYNYQYDDTPEYTWVDAYYVVCPVCQEHIDLDTNRIPTIIRNKATRV